MKDPKGGASEAADSTLGSADVSVLKEAGPDVERSASASQPPPSGRDPSSQHGPSAEPPPRSLAANFASLATSQLITWSLALLWTFFVPRLVGPEGVGLLGIATSVTAVVAVVLSQPPKDYMVREIKRNPAEAPRLVVTALAMRVLTIPVLLAAATGYGRLADLDGYAMTVMYIMAGATVCTMLIEPALATFQAKEQMQFTAYTDVSNKTLQTLGGVLLAVAGYGVAAIAGLSLVVAVLTCVLALVWVRRLMRLSVRPSGFLQILRGGLPYWSVALFFVGYLWADGLILGLLVPTEVVGWYGAATRVFTTMMFVAVIISTVSLPRLIAAFTEGERRFAEVARVPLMWSVILGLPIGVGIALIAPSAVPLLYGGEFAGAVPALVVLGLCVPVMYVNIMIAQVLIASGRPWMMARLLAVAVVVNVTLNAVLVPYTQQHYGNGATGAAVSMLLTELVQAGFGLAIAGRWVLSRPTMARMAAAALAAAGMAGVLSLIDGAILPLQILVGAIVFIALALVLKVVSPDDRALATAQVRGVVQRVRAREKEGVSR